MQGLDGRTGSTVRPAIESAAYYVVVETLTNVAKYAAGASASVDVVHTETRCG